MNIGLDPERRRKAGNYYLVAIGLAIGSAVILWIVFTMGSFIVRMLFKYWIWLVGGVIIFLIVRKIFTRKVMVIKNDPNRPI